MKDRLVGILKVNQKQVPYVSVTIGQGNEQKEFRYEVREKIPTDCEIGDLVSFKINEIPHKTKVNAVFRIAVGLRKVNQDVLNEKSYTTTIVINEWAVANNVKAKDVVELLQENGVNVENPSSRVNLNDLEKIRSKILPQSKAPVKKKETQEISAIPKDGEMSKGFNSSFTISKSSSKRKMKEGRSYSINYLPSKEKPKKGFFSSIIDFLTKPL